MPETSYEALAFGYDGGATTKLSRLAFNTPKANTAADVTFTFALTGKENSKIIIEPSDESVLYLWGSISENDYAKYYNSTPENLKTHIKNLADAYIPDIYQDFTDYVLKEGQRGKIEEDHWIWEGDGKYLFYAVSMNPDGTFAETPQVSEMYNF